MCKCGWFLDWHDLRKLGLEIEHSRTLCQDPWRKALSFEDPCVLFYGILIDVFCGLEARTPSHNNITQPVSTRQLERQLIESSFGSLWWSTYWAWSNEFDWSVLDKLRMLPLRFLPKFQVCLNQIIRESAVAALLGHQSGGQTRNNPNVVWSHLKSNVCVATMGRLRVMDIDEADLQQLFVAGQHGLEPLLNGNTLYWDSFKYCTSRFCFKVSEVWQSLKFEACFICHFHRLFQFLSFKPGNTALEWSFSGWAFP